MPVDLARRWPMAGQRSGRAIGRPQVARAMVAAGHVADTREAFDKWLGRDQPAFVPRSGPSPETVIETIHRAGGLASLAHPGRTRIDRRIPALRDAGLDALEAYHSDHDAAAGRPLSPDGRRARALLTGGSDYPRRSRARRVDRKLHTCRPSAGSGCTRHGIDMPPPDSLVQIRKITKDYRSLRPLRIESLDLHEGETLALCGFDHMTAEILVRFDHRGHRA